MSRLPLLATATVIAAAALALGLPARAESPPVVNPLRPLPQEPPPVELAPYMGELQRLTHKLSLSVGAGNERLATFYAYESLELLREIQRDVPEYDGQPIALLIDRMALPPIERLNLALKAGAEADDPAGVRRALEDVVAACNECHRQTLHGFIKITVDTKANPFNQDFTPRLDQP